MYTICWNDECSGSDRWERCETREELRELIQREGLMESDEDSVLVFAPGAEDFLLSAAEVMENEE